MTLKACWVTLRARWVTLRACWVTLRACWVTLGRNKRRRGGPVDYAALNAKLEAEHAGAGGAAAAPSAPVTVDLTEEPEVTVME